MQADTQMITDPDFARWASARNELANEIGFPTAEDVPDEHRHYVEKHALAQLIAQLDQEAEDEALYMAAASAVEAATADMLPPALVAPMHEISARVVPVIVHSVLRDRLTRAAGLPLAAHTTT